MNKIASAFGKVGTHTQKHTPTYMHHLCPSPSHVDNTEAAVEDVLLQELMSLEPVAFQNVAVDIDSLRLTSKSVCIIYGHSLFC